MIKNSNRKNRGLGKYDAPLRFQFDQGYSAFRRGKQFNPFNKDTMQYREWERGSNKAFFDQRKRVREYESTTARSRAIPKGEV